MISEGIKHILVVNDNVIIQDFYQKVLSAPARHVEMEGFPYRYLKSTPKKRPDLIILDRKFGKIDIVENCGYKEFIKIAPTILASCTLPPDEQTREVCSDYIRNMGFYGIASDVPEKLEDMLSRVEKQRAECEYT